MAKTKQKFSRDIRKPIKPPAFNFPAVSVIIPLYNSERYIGDALNSLLAQTFQNFEVIVVDDCSTDSSCAVVENYAERFGGRLKLAHTKRNSGSAGIPRNKGMEFSRGEYIYFLDSDDSITPTAFEELYSLAKEYDADVVFCEKYFETDSNGTNVRLVSKQGGSLVDSPVFQSEDFKERVKDILHRDIWGTPWSKFTRRNILIENELRFPNLRPCEDYLWTLNLFFSLRKFLRVPNAVYVWRQTKNSITRSQKTAKQNVTFWLNPVILGLKWLDEKLIGIEFFKNNLAYRYAVLEFVLKKMFNLCLNDRFKLPSFEIYDEILQDFGEVLGKQDVLVSVLFSWANALQINNIMTTQKFNQFASQAQRRIAELEAALKAK